MRMVRLAVKSQGTSLSVEYKHHLVNFLSCLGFCDNCDLT